MTSKESSLIKGYQPVRVKLKDEEETFFYIKEHRTKEAKSTSTLFVANAPTIPGIPSHKVLMALLGPYGDIDTIKTVNQQLKQQDTPVFLPPSQHGSFAHVECSDRKHMLRILKELQQLMVSSEPHLELGALELQSLRDDEEEEGDDIVQTLVQRYRSSITPRDEILEDCNRIMRDFERAEEQARRAISNTPDEDGFITVTATNQPVLDEGEDDHAEKRRRRPSKSRRKRQNTADGAAPQERFYRFQTKEKQKQSLQELRQQFEKDVAKVQQMKNRIKPF